MKPKKTRSEKFFKVNKVKYYIKNASPRIEIQRCRQLCRGYHVIMQQLDAIILEKSFKIKYITNIEQAVLTLIS